MDVRTGHKEGWAPKNSGLWIVVLEKTLESLLDSKEIKPVNPKGNQPWVFIGTTDVEAPILWPPDVKNKLIGKDPDAGEDWRLEKRATEEEIVGWHHWLNGHEFEKPQEIVKDRKAWHAAVHWVAKSWTLLNAWITITTISEWVLGMRIFLSRWISHKGFHEKEFLTNQVDKKICGVGISQPLSLVMGLLTKQTLQEGYVKSLYGFKNTDNNHCWVPNTPRIETVLNAENGIISWEHSSTLWWQVITLVPSFHGK